MNGVVFSRIKLEMNEFFTRFLFIIHFTSAYLKLFNFPNSVGVFRFHSRYSGKKLFCFCLVSGLHGTKNPCKRLRKERIRIILFRRPYMLQYLLYLTTFLRNRIVKL